MRNQIFFSYSHRDKRWLEQLQTMLRPLVRDKKISVWDDSDIKSGTKWRDEINKALESAKVAVLLVSPDFLASDFIANHELPPLLETSEKAGLVILWVAIRHSLYRETEIERYQAVNDPSKPLADMRPSDRERILVEICGHIKRAADDVAKTVSSENSVKAEGVNLYSESIEDIISKGGSIHVDGLDEPWSIDEVSALLSFIWMHPSDGPSSASLATKESALMKGQMDLAIRLPGLGTSILTSAFAQQMFGEAARTRVEVCIRWALAKTQPQSPFYVLAENTDSITFSVTSTPDFRHTIALAVIMARWQSELSYRRHYLNEVLASQNEHGAWEAAESWPKTDIFTVLYALELLTLCSNDENFDYTSREKAVNARNAGLRWLSSQVNRSGLWQSGVMDEEAWDSMWTTVWVLDRLLSTEGLRTLDESRHAAARALLPLIRLCNKNDTWANKSLNLRFLMEARIASTVRLILRSVRDIISPIAEEEAELFHRGWTPRAHAQYISGEIVIRDIATPVFLLKAIAEPTALHSLARRISESST